MLPLTDCLQLHASFDPSHRFHVRINGPWQCRNGLVLNQYNIEEHQIHNLKRFCESTFWRRFQQGTIVQHLIPITFISMSKLSNTTRFPFYINHLLTSLTTLYLLVRGVWARRLRMPRAGRLTWPRWGAGRWRWCCSRRRCCSGFADTAAGWMSWLW